MEKVFVFASLAAFFVRSAIATAGELPSFERSGFPITPVQVSVLGAADVQERSSTPDLILHGMPASPHQLAVLTPRQKHANVASEPSSTMPGSREVTAYRAFGE